MDLLTPDFLAQVVRDELARTELSAREIERRSGIPRNTLERRLNSGELTLGNLIAVARLLGLRLSALVRLAEQRAA